jgi:hypothetical protein
VAASWRRERGPGEDGDDPVSPAAKLCGFLLLLAVVFIGAYAAGAHLGPVTVGTPGTSSPAPTAPANPASPGTGGSMNMSGP